MDYITRGIAISQCQLSFGLMEDMSLYIGEIVETLVMGVHHFAEQNVLYPFFIASAYGERYCPVVSVITK